MSLLSFIKKVRGLKAKTSAVKKSRARRKQAGVAKPEKPVSATASAVSGIDLQLLLTEKGVRLQEGGVVTFRVVADASKSQIAEAVKARYNTVPRKIRTVPMVAKRRRRGQTRGMTAAWKKAYVQVDDVQSFNAGA